MECDWKNSTINFSKEGRTVTLQGLQEPPLQLSSISAKKVYNYTKGNDIWAVVLLDHIPDSSPIKKKKPFHLQKKSKPSSLPTRMYSLIQNSCHLKEPITMLFHSSLALSLSIQDPITALPYTKQK
jgi:hypothetical protein